MREEGLEPSRPAALASQTSVSAVPPFAPLKLEDGVGFEPTDPQGPPVFKAGALDRSANHPKIHQKLGLARIPGCHDLSNVVPIPWD